MGNQVALIASEDIPAGGEVSDSYGPSSLVHDRDTRRNNLSANYSFLCNCVACTDEHPLFRDRDLKMPSDLEEKHADFLKLESPSEDRCKEHYESLAALSNIHPAKYHVLTKLKRAFQKTYANLL